MLISVMALWVQDSGKIQIFNIKRPLVTYFIGLYLLFYFVSKLCFNLIFRGAEQAIKFINSDRALNMVANQARPPKHFDRDNARQPMQNVKPEEKPSFMQGASDKSQPPNRFSPRQPNQSSMNNVPRPPHQSNMNPIPQQNPIEEAFQSWRSARESEPNRQAPSNRPINMGNRREMRDQRQPKPAETRPNNTHMTGPQRYQRGTIDPNVGQCGRCQRRAELKCQRCGDFYCSFACQKSDWPTHKRHCFPMPELVPADEPVNVPQEAPVKATASPNGNGTHFNQSPETMKKDLTPNFPLPFNNAPKPMSRFKPDRMIVFCDDDPKSGDIVAITWPCSTNRVYIVQNDGKMGEEYRDVLTWASRPENHGSPFSESPEKGTLVFAEFENDWYRAIVQKVIDSQHVLVAFFDFGNVEQLPYTKLRQFTGNDDPIRYTYSVYLKDCPYDVAEPLPANVAEYLKKFSDDFTPLRMRYNGDWNRSTNVELFVAETDVCINEKICALLGTSRAECRKNREEAHHKILKEARPEKIEKFYFDDLRCERMETENKTRVIILCCDDLESNSIWCCLETANTSIKEIDDAVNDFASKEGNLKSFLPE